MSNTNKFYNAERETQQVRRHMMLLADSFSITGNSKVAKLLAELVGDLDREIEVMRTAFNEQIDTAFKDAQQSSINMLKATLAGCELGKRGENA